MSEERAPAPPRGTRPRNRRALIVGAATELFLRNGYERVSMSDVANAVNVRPSALYRHFSGKARLLTAAVVEEMSVIRAVLDDPPGDLDVIGELLAAVAVDRRQLGTLWQREARGLPAEEYERLRAEVLGAVKALAKLVGSNRPDLAPYEAKLLASCTYSALCGLSHHVDDLPRDQCVAVFRDILHTILRAEPVRSERGSAAPESPGLSPVGRRERLLSSAIELFAEHGYTSVGMDDIGRQSGIAAPSVYHHFESKQQLLSAALARGDEWLRHDMYWALKASTTPEEGLFRVITSYIDFAARHPRHIDILITEARHLDTIERARTKQTQRDYINEWVHLMLATQPARSETEARVRVHAMLAVANDVARTVEYRSSPNALETVKRFTVAIALPGDR